MVFQFIMQHDHHHYPLHRFRDLVAHPSAALGYLDRESSELADVLMGHGAYDRI